MLVAHSFLPEGDSTERMGSVSSGSSLKLKVGNGFRRRAKGGKVTRIGVMYRVPALVTVDLEAGTIESVEIDNEIRISAWTGACVEERRGRVLRGAHDEEIDRALRIVSQSPWPEARLTVG